MGWIVGVRDQERGVTRARGGRLVTLGAVWLPYLKTNVWWGLGGGDAPVHRLPDRGREQGHGGLTAKFGPSVSLDGDASYLWSVDGRDNQTTRGTIGLRVTW